MLFNIFKKKTGKDQYLEKVAFILHSTVGPTMPIENAYNLAAECLGELRGNILNGMFHDGPNPREALMVYYSLCSMVRDSRLDDDRETVLMISIMAQVLTNQFKDGSNFTPLEKGICLFGKKTLLEGFPKHTKEEIVKIKIGAAEMIFNLMCEQGASIHRDNIMRLVDNVSANVGERDTYKSGDKVLAISVLTNVTAYSIDQGDIQMANIYFNCVTSAFNKYFKGQMESFNDYQAGAVRVIMREYSSVVKELVKANNKS